MELSKKTTILFSEALHARLQSLARHQGTSIGSLVRSACIQQYGLRSSDDRLAAVQEISALGLPVASPEEMAAESVPSADALLP